MNVQSFPKWQIALREAQEVMCQNLFKHIDTPESNKNRSEAKDLRQVLQMVFAMPVEPLKCVLPGESVVDHLFNHAHARCVDLGGMR